MYDKREQYFEDKSVSEATHEDIDVEINIIERKDYERPN